jgi:hypothetical protein
MQPQTQQKQQQQQQFARPRVRRWTDCNFLFVLVELQQFGLFAGE